MSGSKTSLDRLEQATRIKQMRVDIQLKQQSLRYGQYQLFATLAGVFVALLAAIFSGVKLFFGP